MRYLMMFKPIPPLQCQRIKCLKLVSGLMSFTCTSLLILAVITFPPTLLCNAENTSASLPLHRAKLWNRGLNLTNQPPSLPVILGSDKMESFEAYMMPGVWHQHFSADDIGSMEGLRVHTKHKASGKGQPKASQVGCSINRMYCSLKVKRGENCTII